MRPRESAAPPAEKTKREARRHTCAAARFPQKNLIIAVK